MPSAKRLVGLRLDDATYKQLQELARADMRSVASMAEVLFFRGYNELVRAPKKKQVKR